MSMFICARCDGYRDSDDGCEEGPNNTLICIDCISDEPDEPAHTYDEIYETLTKAGCPDDIAHELGEKSK